MIISKQQLVENITTELSDNSTGQISPYDIRHNLLDIIDSVHILMKGKDLNTNNLASLDARTTKVGEDTLRNYNVTNSKNEDNSAFGYSSLRNNFQGIKNTAIGSSALSCNVYGSDNLAVGHKAVSSNTNGYGNVGIGNYTLASNKFGNFNIALGHGAGYYIGDNQNNKLYIASHPIDSDYICDNPLGLGLTPLVFGDLINLKFGIAVNELHNDGVLQVSGAIAPSQDGRFNLGSNSYQFNKLFVSNSIVLPSGNISQSYSLSGIAFSNNLVPDSDSKYDLGSLNNRWNRGYFDELIANSYTVVDQCRFSCKTLYIASSGECEPDNPCGYLNDQELEDAGFLIQSSGDNDSYKRDYYFQFKPSDWELTFVERSNVYARSSWNSNISIHLSDGCHVKTDRILGSGNLSLVTQPSGWGIFVRDNDNGRNMYFSQENAANHSANGIGNINFLHGTIPDLSATGDYVCTYGAYQSGVNISQRFLTGIKLNQLDGNNDNKQKLKGFEIKCFDDSNMDYTGPLSDRFTINSYDNTSEPIHSLVLMKGGDSEGVVGINDFEDTSHLKLPETTLNVRSATNSIIRATAESNGYYQSSLQLFGHENCINSGVEFTYYNRNGIADISMYKDSNNEIFIRMDEDSKIGFFAVSGQMDDMITIGGSGHNQSVVSINETIGSVSSTEKYGKIFVKEKIVSDKQSSSLYFLDSSGNLFDLSLNMYSDDDGGLLFTDNNRNTLAGIGCNSDRLVLDSSDATDNTAIGYYALNELASGDYNVVVGCLAGSRISKGSNNVIIGYNALGNSGPSVSNNIIIGNSSLGYEYDVNNLLLIGNGLFPLLSGNLTGLNRQLFMPNGKLSVESNDGTQSLTLQNNVIEVTDNSGDDYPQNQLMFKFTGNETANLLILKHSEEPLSNSPTYEFSDSGIPYAELKGDLRLQNAIRFSDNTSLYSSSEITFASGLSIENSNILSSLLVEGIAQENVSIASFNIPTSGVIRTRDNRNIYVSNRDQFLQINRNDFVIAIKINNEYRPLWVSSESTACDCCGK